MRICPHCKNELKIIPNAIYNMEAYGGTTLVRADCCGLPLMLTRSVTVNIEATATNAEVDDWDQPLRKEKEK